MKKKLSIILSALLVNGFSYASEEVGAEEELFPFFGGEEMISIATGYSKAISKAPAVASVITSEDIKRMGATDIDMVLETIPGLHVARDVVAHNPIYTFRGIYADFNPQVLMLINGVPVTNLFHGDRNLVWGGMPVQAIERIEVIRGPGSAIYGADAFAGVINVVTKGPEDISGVSSGIRYGSFRTKDAWLSVGDSAGGVKYSAVIEMHKTEGQDEKIEADAQSLLDMLSGTNASYAPESMNLGRESWDARFQLDYKTVIVRAGAQVRKNVENGAGAAQALDPVNRFGSERLNADVTFQDALYGGDLEFMVQLSYLQTSQEVEDDLVLFPPGSTGPFAPPIGIFANGVIGDPEVYEKHTRFNFFVDYHGFLEHKLRMGAGYYYGDVYRVEEEKNFGFRPDGSVIMPGEAKVNVSDTPYVFLREDDRENKFIYFQDVWQLANDWELTAGIRYDHYSDFGSTTNPRAALVWSARHDLTVKALYGEAFRAPSFGQTRAINNPSILGNPELNPETIKSYEVAFDYRPRYDLSLIANLFYYKWEDIIQFIPDPGGSRTAQNAGEQLGHGMEFEVKWEASENLTLSGNFAWQKSKDENLDADAANAPEKQLYGRADWDFAEDWNLNLQANWVMGRNRVKGDPRNEIDDYVLVDLTMRRTNLWKNFEAALMVRNLFDEDAREPSPNGDPVPFIPDDLPLAGRSILGELRYQF